jgi:hypothetical protein
MSAANNIEVPRTPFQGGRRPMVTLALVGAIGVVAWFASIGSTPQRAGYGWLWAFFYWLTIPFGCLGWLSAFHAAKAKWPVLPRRTLELIASTIGLFAVLFIPVVIWMKDLFPWQRPDQFGEEAQRLFEHRHLYLNTGFFLLRAAIYFVIFIGVSELHLRWSLAQDKGDRPLNTLKSWRLGPGSLPFLGFALSFGAFDWLMSLNVTYYSSMFGLNVIAGAVMAGMAVWILTNLAVGTPMSGHHLHSMGKLLFAFVCFWGYTAFSQFMLIWIADIPDETPWFHYRLDSEGWTTVGWFLVVFHFAVPFVILLSKRLKFSPRRLGFMCVWLLIAHAVDIYWIVMPQFTANLQPPTVEGPHLALADFFAFVGIGGLATAFLIFRMRGKNLVPIGDPFLPASLEYHP